MRVGSPSLVKYHKENEENPALRVIIPLSLPDLVSAIDISDLVNDDISQSKTVESLVGEYLTYRNQQLSQILSFHKWLDFSSKTPLSAGKQRSFFRDKIEVIEDY